MSYINERCSQVNTLEDARQLAVTLRAVGYGTRIVEYVGFVLVYYINPADLDMPKRKINSKRKRNW